MSEYNFFLQDKKLSKLLDLSHINIEEIGDGNLNFVFKISDDKKSYALKHAKPYLKMLGEEFSLNQKRVISEMNSMEYFYSVSPDYLPKIYHKNEKEYFFIMQYLDGYTSLRENHTNTSSYEKLGEFLFSLANNNPKEKLYYECEELKTITKNYIFEYPFIKNHEALVVPEYFAQKEFSKEFLVNLAMLKDIFLNSKKSLIHGDLHTDSIMVKENKIAIIDSEFSLFSDISFDIGNILAHSILSSIAHKNNLYIEKFLKLFSKLESLDNFQNTLQNSIGFCAVEMARRLYVPAKSKDLESIQNLKEKTEAYELSFNIADELGSNMKEFKDVESFLKKLETLI